MNVPDLSIVIPVYCEASIIGNTVAVVTEWIESTNKSYELILIDDGSIDNTWEIIVNLVEKNTNIRAIRFSRNFGKESAILAGLEQAKGKAVIILDADLQHPPELIPQMIQLWEEGYHIVDTQKIAQDEKRNPIYTQCANIFNFIMKKLLGVDFSGASDYKLLDRRVVEILNQMGEVNRFFRGMTEWVGFKHIKIPMKVQKRVGGESKWSLYQLVRLAVTAMTSFSTAALQGVAVIGLLFILVSFFFSIYVLYLWVNGSSLQGFPTVILLQLISTGTILLCLGIIGEYLSTIFWETKKRPKYIIMEKIEK